MRKRFAKGFTLIELMIVVAIIAILASLAYFSYSRYAFRTRRADGREMLMRVASAEERYYTNFNQYAIGAITTDPPAGLGFAAATSERGYYTVNVANGPGGGGDDYVLTAVPQNDQAGDACGSLTLDSAGVKSWSTSPTESNGKCW